MIIKKFNSFWNEYYLLISIFCSSLCVINFYFEIVSMLPILYILNTYLFLDTINCIINKKDFQYIVHHLAGMSMTFYSIYRNFYTSKYSSIFINMENSTPILNLILYLKKYNNKYIKYLSKLLFIVFYCIFMYFRIIKYYYIFLSQDFIQYYYNLYLNDKTKSILFLNIRILTIKVLNLIWAYKLTARFFKYKKT